MHVACWPFAAQRNARWGVAIGVERKLIAAAWAADFAPEPTSGHMPAVSATALKT